MCLNQQADRRLNTLTVPNSFDVVPATFLQVIFKTTKNHTCLQVNRLQDKLCNLRPVQNVCCGIVVKCHRLNSVDTMVSKLSIYSRELP